MKFLILCLIEVTILFYSKFIHSYILLNKPYNFNSNRKLFSISSTLKIDEDNCNTLLTSNYESLENWDPYLISISFEYIDNQNKNINTDYTSLIRNENITNLLKSLRIWQNALQFGVLPEVKDISFLNPTNAGIYDKVTI